MNPTTIPVSYTEQIQSIPIAAETRNFILNSSIDKPKTTFTNSGTGASFGNLDDNTSGFYNNEMKGTKLHGDKLLTEVESKQKDLEGGSTWIDGNTCVLESESTKFCGDKLLWNDNAKTYFSDWNSNPTYESTSSTTGTSSFDWKTDFAFPRQSSSETTQLEEKERSRRIASGVNPLVYGKYFQIHKELLDTNGNWFWTSLPTTGMKEVTSTLTDSAEHLKEVAIEKTESFSTTFSHLKDSLRDSTTHIVELARDSLGLNPSSLKSVTRAEEKERSRRMEDKVDPMIDARKRRVEEQLLKTVHSC